MDNAKKTISSSAPTSHMHKVRLKFTGIRASGLPKSKFYFSVSIDGTTQETEPSKADNTVAWSNSFSFDASRLSSFRMRIYEIHIIRRNKCIGEIKGSIGSLLDDPSIPDLTRNLQRVGGNEDYVLPVIINLNVKVEENGTQSPLDEATRTAVLGFRSMPGDITHATTIAETAIQEITTITDPWMPLLEKLEVFSNMVDKVAEVHPYAKMAWSVLSAAHKMVITQLDRDEKVQGLLVKIDDAYAFLQEADSLNKIESHRVILARLAQQTTECGYFITSYAKDKSFWARMLNNALSKADAAINGYIGSFKQIKEDFQARGSLQTEIMVFRMAGEVESLSKEIDLNDMPYAHGAGFDSTKECLPGTRTEVLDEITDWINKIDDDKRVYVLHGAAGTGKSAIAHTIASRFHKLGRLGSSFCFDRNFQSERRPDNMFSTIARDLADLDPHFKEELWQGIHADKMIRASCDLKAQWERFILNPLKKLVITGPVVIVIDALDESGDMLSRQLLLELLLQHLTQLPSNFRILITCRSEKDIVEAFDEKPHISSTRVDKFASSAKHDIISYIRHSISPHKHLAFIKENELNSLADISEGLFQWAATFCKQMAIGKPGFSPRKLYDTFTALHGNVAPLDALYKQILEMHFNTGEQDVMKEFQSVVGLLMTAFEPLSIASLSEIRRQRSDPATEDEDECKEAIKSIVQYMGSLLSGVTEESIPIRPFHKSFRDFIMDHERSSSFHINGPENHSTLALASLRVMRSLRHNMCHLDTTFLRNVDIADLDARIETYIPPHLSYSCRFWARHLEASNIDSGIQKEVARFLCDSLLSWLEVLSIIGAYHTSFAALVFATTWLNDRDFETAKFAKDGLRFSRTFATSISQSALHVYLSALSFSPQNSLIRQKYFSTSTAHTLHLRRGGLKSWPSLEFVFNNHTEIACSALSADGRRLASSPLDGTIQIWNAETGVAIGDPLRGHEALVSRIAFAPDRQKIVSASWDSTLRIWNAETGVAIGETLRGHDRNVTSVAFSPNGQRIISSSMDGTIRIWSAETGVAIGEPLRGHADGVGSVAISPDGGRIASGSEDNTARLWDAESGATIGEPLLGHDSSVYTVAFSPNGKRIVSGSKDRTIRIWDAVTGHAIGEPLRGHTGYVICIAFSPDGGRIVSGSEDTTVRIWDAESGATIRTFLRGHDIILNSVAFLADGQRILSSDWNGMIRIRNAEIDDTSGESLSVHDSSVTSVVTSADGRRIVSGSWDSTVRIWSAETGAAVGEPLRGHDGDVNAVALSLDGQRIFSGSSDGTVRIWNAETGTAVGEPLRVYENGVIHAVAVSPDGDRIVTCSNDCTIRIWNAETGAAIGESLPEHYGNVNSVSFSPDGLRIVSGSDDDTVRIWSAETGAAIGEPLQGHHDHVNSISLSPDGLRIVSGSRDRTIRIWNAETRAALGEPLSHDSEIRSVAFSPDGKRIVSGSEDNTIRIWDAGTGVAIGEPLRGPDSFIGQVTFSADGQQIVSGTFDGGVRIWDVEMGDTNSTRLHIHDSHPWLMAFSPDGTHLSSQVYLDEDGWIIGPNSELLFWVPPDLHGSLPWPRLKAVAGRDMISVYIPGQ